MNYNYTNEPQFKNSGKKDLFNIENFLALDNIYDAIVILDNDGKILRLNKRGLQLSEYEETTLAGKTMDFIFEHPDMNRDDLTGWLDSYSKRGNGPSARSYSLDASLKTRKEELIPVDLKIVHIDGGDSGQSGYIISATDMRITRQLLSEILERELAMRKLSTSESKFSKLFVFNPIGILITELEDGTITDINPSAEEIFEIPEGSLRGKNLKETGLTLTGMDFETFYEKTAMEGGISEISGEILTSQNYIKKIRLSATPFKFESTARIIISISDITENEKMRDTLRRKEKLESIWNIAGSLVHDFNNILGIILGLASYLKMNSSASSRKESVSQIEKACLRGRELSQELMSFSKGAPPKIKRCNAIDIVNESVKFFSASKGDIAVQISAQKDLWEIQADKSQIMQVIENFLSNAEESMGYQGRIEISLSNIDTYESEGKSEIKNLPPQLGARDFKTRGYVKISVRDYGPGIPPENLEKIFDPFFTTKPGGHGMGLAGVDAIIQTHNGAVTGQNSEDGHGAVFSIFLPAILKETDVPEKDNMPEKTNSC